MTNHSHDSYLQAFEGDRLLTLTTLRALIHQTVPEAEECLSYGIAAFRLKGKHMVGYGGTKQYVSLYLMSSGTLEKFEPALEEYDHTKGTLRFRPGQPLPEDLIVRLIQARLKELES